MGELTPEQWKVLLESADQLKFVRDQVVVKEGSTDRALYQLVAGNLRVERKMEGRPQAVIVGRQSAGDLFGERTLLNGGVTSATIVVDSETAVLVKLTTKTLQKMFKTAPEVRRACAPQEISVTEVIWK